jgi:hypothetical protein
MQLGKPDLVPRLVAGGASSPVAGSFNIQPDPARPLGFAIALEVRDQLAQLSRSALGARGT